MTAFYLRVLLALLSIVVICQAQCNDNGLRNFDKTIARLITIANSGRTFPESKGPELKKFCIETESLLKEVDRYKSVCTKDLAKQLISVTVFSIKNAIKQFCQKKSKRLDALLLATPCLNKNDKLVTKCYTRLIDSLLGAKRADDKKKIPFMCCEYGKLLSCVETELESAPKCNDRYVETIQEFIRSIMGDAVSLICGEFTEGSDKCEKLGPPPKKLKSQRRSNSFAIPFLELVSSFPEI